MPRVQRSDDRSKVIAFPARSSDVDETFADISPEEKHLNAAFSRATPERDSTPASPECGWTGVRRVITLQGMCTLRRRAGPRQIGPYVSSSLPAWQAGPP